jgi:hypothetical protein
MSQSHPPQSASKSESWENEGGSLAAHDLADSLGVVRHMTETYSVGGYQYTNLADAIAQARRMAKLERELL